VFCTFLCAVIALCINVRLGTSDILGKEMKTSDFTDQDESIDRSSFSQEWKVINPYHVHVRRQRQNSEQYIKMSLQLYQVRHLKSITSISLLNSKKIAESKLISDMLGWQNCRAV